MYKSFTELPVWKNSINISIKVFELSNKLPIKEDYGLTSQMRRAANSIGANIAEAFGRQHMKDKINFYIYARGSACETIHHLIYGVKVGYFQAETTEPTIRELNHLTYELNKIIKVMKK